MKSLFILFLFSSFVLSCSFKEERKQKLCLELQKRGVSSIYINNFINNPLSSTIDKKTLKLINPKMKSSHNKAEKKANNNLLKYKKETKKHLNNYKKVYDFVEKKYNVNRGIIAGILLKETRLGKYKPKHNSYVTLNTIYNHIEPNNRRNKWLYKLSLNNLVSLGEYCFNNNIRVYNCSFPSSYIGAIGFPQFMPSNLEKYSESFDGSTPNLNKMEDAIISIGKYLYLRSSFNELLDWTKVPNVKKIEDDWYDFDFKTKKSTFSVNSKKYNCFACSNDDLKYFNSFVNKIMKYNNSSNYSIGVLRLAWELEKDF